MDGIPQGAYNIRANGELSSRNTTENVDIKKMKKKGYTTKGKGHGNGLYYADKIIKRSSILKSENSIINNYYVQK